MESLPPNHSVDPSQAERICHSPVPSSPAPGPMDIRRIRRSHPAHVWPGLAIQLAIALGGDVDSLKRHHVCELYKSGYDTMAQEVGMTKEECVEVLLKTKSPEKSLWWD